MTQATDAQDSKTPSLLLVTGPSGAGRSTAVNALEDLGFEVIDNLPLSLLPPLLSVTHDRPLALGLDVRNRDFGVDALIAVIDGLSERLGNQAQVLFVDAHEDSLLRRYSETRRRHPLAANGSPQSAIDREKELLRPIRARADFLIDTTTLSPHELRAEIDAIFAPGEGRMLGLTIHSFSYKRGLPRGLDIVLDCRFLRNPHWDVALRGKDGRDAAVAAYIAEDPNFLPFFDKVKDLMGLLLPAHKSEGRAHLSIGFGCTGGKHRSVMLTERLATCLEEDGWQVSKRHREMERHDGVGLSDKRGQNV